MSINVVEKIDDFVKVKHVLASVFDKSGLESFIPELLRINPEIKFFSTGGTYKKIKEILGETADSCLTQVSDYTGQPETQGGLVKTLDFKIYLGLLTETYNDAHDEDIHRTGSVHIDMTLCNLYPFKDTISKADVTVEMARGQQRKAGDKHPDADDRHCARCNVRLVGAAEDTVRMSHT